jgi:DNA-binding NtrC family response regulator
MVAFPPSPGAGPFPDTGPPLVACINSSEDVVQLLADWFREEGFRAVSYVTPIRYGTAPVVQFVTALQPDVCVYTVSIPYQESWAEFQALRRAAPEVPFVLTTTNVRALRELVGPVDLEPYELFGKPFDLDQVCQAVRRALGLPQVTPGEDEAVAE